MTDSTKVSKEVIELLASFETQPGPAAGVLAEVQKELNEEIAGKAKAALLKGGRAYVDLLTKLRKERLAMQKLEANITSQMDAIKVLLTKVNDGDVDAIDNFTANLTIITSKSTGYVNAY